MRTVVLQSFRSHDRPAWLEACLASVQAWARQRGYEYRFMGDEFFDVLPEWMPSSAGTVKTIAADYARVLWAQRLLREGWQRFVWVDADVLVFVPAELEVETVGSFGLCHEVLAVDEQGQLCLHDRINNAISVYCNGNPFLDFYAYAMEQKLREQPLGAHDALGTVLLSSLGMIMPMPVLFNVALFSPLIVQALAQGDAAMLRHFAEASRAPLAAGNFCQSLRGHRVQGVEMSDALFAAAVERCLGGDGRSLMADISG